MSKLGQILSIKFLKSGGQKWKIFQAKTFSNFISFCFVKYQNIFLRITITFTYIQPWATIAVVGNVASWAGMKTSLQLPIRLYISIMTCTLFLTFLLQALRCIIKEIVVENVSAFELLSIQIIDCNLAIQLIESKYLKIAKSIQIIEF